MNWEPPPPSRWSDELDDAGREHGNPARGIPPIPARPFYRPRRAVRPFRAGAGWAFRRLLDCAWACLLFYGLLYLLEWLSRHPFNPF